MKKRVLVGMSGGVDSSVAAHLLQEQGYEVEGLSFVLWEARHKSDFSTCCSQQAINAAAETAEMIGIRHNQIDVRNEFVEQVIDPFIDLYSKGLTPNPCVLCNQHIKFPYLLEWARGKHFDYIATGHYARVIDDYRMYASSLKGDAFSLAANRHPMLLKGTDPQKDQSYFLYVLTHDQLDRLMLPLGQYRKAEVRTIAQQLGFGAAERPESQEICFIEDRNYFKFISKISPMAGKEGPIIDMEGNVIGTHRGLYAYTMGQRKGMGIAAQDPLYVIKIDHVKNAIYVGPRDMAFKSEFSVRDLHWLIQTVREESSMMVKIRSTMMAESGKVIILNNTARVIFDQPQWAPTPGQSAVFYVDDIVAGGGIIH